MPIPREIPIPLFAVLLIAALSFPLAGCSPAGVAVSAGATAATAAQKEKGFRQAFTDREIQLEINALLLQEHETLFRQVSVTVEEGRVLLTGEVDRLEQRLTAVRTAWQAGGVREVINEVQVGDESSVENFARDVWISTKLGSTMLLDKKVRSIDYSVETVNFTVYLMGIARSRAELDRVIGHAKNIDYVRGVVSYVRLKDGPVATN